MLSSLVKGGHGVGAGQVHGDELLLAAVVGLLDGVFLLLHRDAPPSCRPVHSGR